MSQNNVKSSFHFYMTIQKFQMNSKIQFIDAFDFNNLCEMISAIKLIIMKKILIWNENKIRFCKINKI